VALGVTAACTPRTRRTPDDTIVLVIPNLIRDLDPRYAITNYDTKLSLLVAPGLMTTDQLSLEPLYDLAESIERGGDDLTWDVTLKPGLRFSDGSPVTAEDVVFTFMSTMSPAMKTLYRESFSQRFVSVTALDARRARFRLVEPVATLFSDLDFGILSHEAAGKDGRFSGGKVVGAGPYRVVRVSADRVLLERNPFYHGPQPKVARLEAVVVRDQNAQALMLVGGSADIIQNSVRMDLVDDITDTARLHATNGPSAILSYLMMNNEHPILSDRRVRQAIAFAIDREAIIEGKFRGRAVLATGLMPPSHWSYSGDVPRYLHDPARAMKLLDEAGYPDPDGPGGAPRFRLTYKTSADQFRVAVARILAEHLRQVGIEVEVRAFEFGTFFMDIKKGNFELSSMQTSPVAEPDMAYTYYHSSRVPTAEDINVHNRWRYRNATLDALLEAGRRELDREKRRRIYAEVQRILATDLPVVPLWHEDNVAIMNVDLHDFHVLPNARFRGLVGASKER
jgi:peptide/nickel transport system substrate-binding protein